MFSFEMELENVCGASAPSKARLSGFVLKNYDEYCKNRKRPAVLVLPGGGYGFVSEREATPVAMEFLAAGISAFVLRYSVAPDVQFPAELVEVYTALRMIREHASEWNIDPEQIIVCGFSAGGHLAASAGVFWNRDWVKELGFSDGSHRPNGMILCYPVITGGKYADRDSFRNLLGDRYSEETVAMNSLETQVSLDTPRCFLWHTRTDSDVPVQNSLLFASALAEQNVPFELHVYPEGEHGLSLANELVCDKNGVLPKVQEWIPAVKSWIYGH